MALINYCHKLGHRALNFARKGSADVNIGSIKRCFGRHYLKKTSAVITTLNYNVPHRKFSSSSAARGPSSSSDGRSIFSHRKVNYKVDVKTGDQLQAGTDAKVCIVLHGESGEISDPINLDYFFRDDFERGQLDIFQLQNMKDMKNIHKIEIWRNSVGLGPGWFLDYIEIEDISSTKRFMFPVFRWIKPHKHYVIHHMDNSLPQFDPEPEYRHEELEEKRTQYECTMKVPGGPSQASCNII